MLPTAGRIQGSNKIGWKPHQRDSSLTLTTERQYLGDPAPETQPEMGILTGRKISKIRTNKARWRTPSLIAHRGTREEHRTRAGIAGLAEEGGWKQNIKGENRSSRERQKGPENSNPAALLGKSLLGEVPPTVFPPGSFWDNATRATSHHNNYITLTHPRFLLMSVQIVIFDSSKSIHWIFL